MKTLLRDIKVTFPYINMLFKRRVERGERQKFIINELENITKDPGNPLELWWKLFNLRLAQLQPLPDKYTRKAKIISPNIGGNNIVIKNTPTIGEDGVIHIKIDE